MGNAVKDMVEALGIVIDGKAREILTHKPGKITAYDATDQRAQVQVLLKSKSAAGQLFEPKPIPNVPVLFQRSGGVAHTDPVSVGDTGMLIFFDRSIDAWLEQGGMVDPKSRRHHDLNDCAFLPGLHYWGDAISTASATDSVWAFEDGSIKLSLTSGGKAVITGNAHTASDILVDGVASSFHTTLGNSLTEIQAFAAAFGVPLTNTASLIALLAANTFKSGKGQA